MKTFIDPVCGMTVGESSLRADGFEGVAFCAPGCRTAFLANPSAYLPEASAPASTETSDENGDREH